MEIDGLDVMYVSETRLEEFRSHPIGLTLPSKATVVSPLDIDAAPERDGDLCATEKRKKWGGAATMWKRMKPDAPTLTRRWQEK